ncbi:hypothetical protein HYT55_05185 [Candidatus Woesearchaeota archaeon]|nr:hypothetical protein [Candidatus Woesearchaeota archaeon]
MGKYQLTLERAAAVLKFRGVPNRKEGMVELLRAAGLENLNGRGEKRGIPLGECPRGQLYATAQRIYASALELAPVIAAQRYQASLDISQATSVPSFQTQVDLCEWDWRRRLVEYHNLGTDEAASYSTANLERMLCGDDNED